MHGWLDVLETRGSALVGARKAWTRRFLVLNATFQALELFTDASQLERVSRVDLSGDGVQVATAEQLGEALRGSSKLSAENSRRFVLRVAHTADGKPRLLYLCAEVPDDVASSRECLAQWLRALRRVVDASSATRSSIDTAKADPRALTAQIAAFTERLHLSATVVGRLKPGGSPARYQLLVKAWVLARELASDADDRQSWQVSEYACDWRVERSTAQLRDLDAHLRQFAGRELRDVGFPSVGASASVAVSRLLHAGDNAAKDADSVRRVALYDVYVQGVLRLPALSLVGSDAGAVLDTFLEVPAHLMALRKVERETGTSLHLSQRQVVPWSLCVRFEELHAAYMEQLHAREQQLVLQRQQQQEEADHKQTHDREKAKREHRHHSRSRHERPSMRATVAVTPLPAPISRVVAPAEAEDPSLVQERIARIGHKLIAEAFMLPTRPLAAEPVLSDV